MTAVNRTGALLGLLGFVVGAVGGAAGVAALSKRASRSFLAMARTGFVLEEAEQVRTALSSGRVQDAIIHATCALEADKDGRALAPGVLTWPLEFPVVGVGASSRVRLIGRDDEEALALGHARLGVALERGGRRVEAKGQYDPAAKTSNRFNAEGWRAAAAASLRIYDRE